MPIRNHLFFASVIALFVAIGACSEPDHTAPPSGDETDTGTDVGTDTGTDTDAEPPLCDDGTQSGDQTDVDCGGPDCDPCDVGQSCDVDADCQTDDCDDGVCVDSTVVPDAPTDLRAVRSDEAARLQWTAPDDTETPDLIGYRVTVYGEDGDAPDGVTGDESREIDGESTTLTFDGLTNDETYAFRVEAENEAGLGDASELSENVVPRPPFVSTWHTEHNGDSGDDQIELPLESDGAYDFIIDWGDGETSHITDDETDVTHTYDASGTYTLAIDGKIEGFRFGLDGDGDKLEEIEQWGVLQFGDNGGYLAGASNLEITAEDVPDLRGTTDMTEAFRACWDLETLPGITDWDTSQVTRTRRMFHGASNFDQDLTGLDTSAVTDMRQMFADTMDFNGDLSDWDTSQVTDMSDMFWAARSFDGDVTDWDTSQVTDMSDMFNDTWNFDGDISGWDTSQVTDMSGMFRQSTDFDGYISDWDTSQVTDMSAMFEGASSFNQDLSDWDTSQVTDMSNMFASFGTSAFDGDISDWDTSRVTDMSAMFSSAGEFDGDITGWDTSEVTNMRWMFSAAESFDQDLSNWDTSRVTDMSNMFAWATAFDRDIGDWDVTSVTEMNEMFAENELSTDNYDRLLSGWAEQDVESGVDFDAGSSTYSQAAEDDRQSLIDDHDWTITDGNLVTD